MTKGEIITLVVSIVLLLLLCGLFTYLFLHYFTRLSHEVEEGKEDDEIKEIAAKKDKKKSRKVWRITGKVLGDTLLLALVAAFIYSLYSRVHGNEPMVGGHEVLLIGSGSMSYKNSANGYLEEHDLNNQFDTYDLVGIKSYDAPEDIKLYDVVAYKSPTNVTVVHRIIEVKEVEGETVYVTRGDANEISDNDPASQERIYSDYLHSSSIIGYYDGFRWKKIGYLISYLQSAEGIASMIAILYCVSFFSYEEEKYSKVYAAREALLTAKTTNETIR
jgi:signal peptidase